MSRAVKEIIDKQSADWEKAFHSKQWKKLSELYTEDCKVYPPGLSICIGRAECARAWESLGNKGVDRIILENIEVEYDGGDYAADYSTYVMKDRSGREIDHGKYVVVWRKVTDRWGRGQKGPQWQLHYDIFTPDTAAKKTSETIVVEQSAKWQHFYQIGDFHSLSKLYTPDCKVFPPHRPIAVGRIACERAWTRLSESGAKMIKLDNVETLDMGDGLAADHSTYKMFDARGRQIDNGKYVVVWKRLEDGQWYLHFDCFNSDNN